MTRKSLLAVSLFFLGVALALPQESEFQRGGKFFKEAEPPPLVVPDVNWNQIQLPNSSFENGTNDYPSDWDRWGKGEFFWPSEAFDGKRSVGLRKTDWSTGWKSLSFPVFADYQNDYPWYFLEAYVKTKGASGRIFISISWYGEKGWLGNSRSPYFLIPDSGSWYRISFCALPPKGALRGEVFLRDDKEITGEVLFDSVKLCSMSLPLSTPVGDDFDSPYISFLADYPSHPLVFYAYLQIAQTAEDKWEGGRKKEDLLACLNAYEDIARNFPLYRKWALSQETQLSIKGGDLKKAEELAKRFFKEYPEHKGEAYYLLSDVSKEAEDYENALTYAKQSLENAKENDWFLSRVRMNYAYCLEHSYKFKEAEEKYREIAERYPDQRPLALLGIGNCAFYSVDYNTALQAVNTLLEEYPTLYDQAKGEAEYIKGLCYFGMNNKSNEAIAQFRKLQEEFPDTRWAAGAQLRIMFVYLEQLDNPELAKKELERLEKIYKDRFPDIVFMGFSRWGSCAFEKGNLAEAIEGYRRAAEIVPQFAPKSLFRIGNCYRLMGNLDEAIKTFQQLLSQYPNDELVPKAMIFLGQCLYQKGQKNQAIEVFEKIISGYPQSEEASEARDWIEFCKANRDEK